MRVTIQIASPIDAATRRLIGRCRLGALLRASGDEMEISGSLTLRLTDNSELHQLNRDFRSVDSPTDVLAFPGEDDHVGDVAISLERAVAQAPGDPVPEIRMLAIHGFLHCLGYDHALADEAQAMTAQTRRLLPDQEVVALVVDP